MKGLHVYAVNHVERDGRSAYGTKVTDFLFARPSFFEGMGRIIDFGGTMTSFNRSSTPEEADSRAMYEDWRVVGNDLRAALARFKRESQAK
jgi:hypothetical protein